MNICGEKRQFDERFVVVVVVAGIGNHWALKRWNSENQSNGKCQILNGIEKKGKTEILRPKEKGNNFWAKMDEKTRTIRRKLKTKNKRKTENFNIFTPSLINTVIILCLLFVNAVHAESQKDM